MFVAFSCATQHTYCIAPSQYLWCPTKQVNVPQLLSTTMWRVFITKLIPAKTVTLIPIWYNSTKTIPQIPRFVSTENFISWPIDHQYFPVELDTSEKMVFDTGKRSAGPECVSLPLSTFFKSMLKFCFKSPPGHSQVLLVSNFFLKISRCLHLSSVWHYSSVNGGVWPIPRGRCSDNIPLCCRLLRRVSRIHLAP